MERGGTTWHKWNIRHVWHKWGVLKNVPLFHRLNKRKNTALTRVKGLGELYFDGTEKIHFSRARLLSGTSGTFRKAFRLCQTVQMCRLFQSVPRCSIFEPLKLMLKEKTFKTLLTKREFTLSQAKEKFQIHPIIEVFEQWAVTTYGIECLVTYYPIERSRLNDNWLEHLQSKWWVDISDFVDAYSFALEYFSKPAALRQKAHRKIARPEQQRLPVSPSLRFQIFKRDNFRCQTCGVTAQDGARLEVDHKIPVARGGTSHYENLWILCFACNRGKGVSEL